MYSSTKDTLKFFANDDLPSNNTYALNLMYHIVVYNAKSSIYEPYVYNGVPQSFQYKSTFSISDYQYFDPNFVVTAHPAKGMTISYLLSPYLNFNKKIDGLYLNTDLNRNYKICIDSAGLYNSTYQSISSSMLYSSIKDTLRLIPTDVLGAGSEYKIKLKYHIEVKSKGAETFKILIKEGVPYYGRFSSSFNTSSQALAIDTSYIEYAYPSPYQYHFLRYETTRGVLKLKSASKSNLNSKLNLNKAGSTFKVRFSTLTGQSWTSDATYDAGKQKFIFQIPSINLENQKIYKIEYIMVNGTGGNETVFLTYHFRTSKFNTFEAKINSVSNLRDAEQFFDGGFAILKKYFDLQEPFDEIEGKEYNGLVRFEAVSDLSNPWMVNFFKFYDGLRENSKYRIKWRSTERVKIPPVNAITLNQLKLTSLLSSEQINENSALDHENKSQVILNNVSYYFIKDFSDVCGQISDRQILNEWEYYFRNYQGWPFETDKYYYFKVKYVAGDVTTYTSNSWSIYYE